MRVSKEQAKRFLLRKQLLSPLQSLFGKNAVEQVFQTLRVIQYDPLNPCGTNPDLVLQSRIFDYHPGDYFQWLYGEKKGIECYDKELCILPIEDFSLSRLRMGTMTRRIDKQEFLKEHQKEIEALLQLIEKEGPISASDFKSQTRVISGWGTESAFSSVALELLWKLGRLVVVKRDKMKKYYDIPTRYHESLVNTSLNHTLTKEHVLRRMKAVGLLPISGSGGGWQGLGSVKELSQVIRELVKEKKLSEVAITGAKRIYVIAAEDTSIVLDTLEQERKVVFIAPLDNLMWDRAMIEELFDFYYRWEVYVPLPKRQYGYYVLPILYGDKFVGRIEPVFRAGTLEIKGLWKEFEWDAEMTCAFERGLEQFQSYLGVSEIIRS
jgi:uncharacterized protein YcaQ